MTVLALDTATRATAVALCRAGADPIEARDDPPADARPRHATQLLPLAADLLAQAGLRWGELGRIAVGIGPGTFTGLRIGLASARALAQALSAPLVGISTPASLALGAWSTARSQGCSLVVAVIDARRGEVFAAAWPVDAGSGDPAALLADPQYAMLSPLALAPSALADWLSRSGMSALAVGDGAIPFRGVLERSGALIAGDGSELHRVSARNHCLLARHLPDSVPESVHPEYLRAPDAKPPAAR